MTDTTNALAGDTMSAEALAEFESRHIEEAAIGFLRMEIDMELAASFIAFARSSATRAARIEALEAALSAIKHEFDIGSTLAEGNAVFIAARALASPAQ